MLKIMVLAALVCEAAGPPPPCMSPPERVFLGAVATNVTAYLGRTMEICGTVGGIGDRDPRERVMYDTSAYNGETHAFYVYDPERALPEEGGRACVTGTPRRRDGFTPAEAIRRGLPNSYTADVALHLPQYVFYPVRCDLDGPALG